MDRAKNQNYLLIVYVILISGLIAFIYSGNLNWLWGRWMENQDYSHGPLIPLISLFIIYQKRNQIREIDVRDSIIGVYVIALAVLIYIVSMRAQVNFALSYSLIILLCGIVLFLGGKQLFFKLAFPICFLFFMVPFWGSAIANLSNALKALSSIATHGIIDLLGYPIFRDGVVLYMNKGALEVADPCSGIRSLMALLALGTVIAYYSNTHVIKKVIIVLLTIPLAFIGNTLRVVFFAVVLENHGVIITEGPLHTISGMAVFAFALAVLILSSKWMSRA